MRVDTVFLDRDGTLNVKAPEGDYVKSPDELELLPGAAEAVARLTAAGLRLIVATNQRGVALGAMSEADVAAVHAALRAELAAAGGELAAIYHCPHHAGACDCRKPRTGMFERARRDFPEIRFERAAVVGDAESDVQAARGIGALPVYLGARADLADAAGVRVEASLAEAAAWLLEGA